MQSNIHLTNTGRKEYHKFVNNEYMRMMDMIVMDVRLNHVYGFDDFHINFTYPRKLSVSLLGSETLEGRDRFRFKKAVILMGTNATGKTSLGRALLKIFKSIQIYQRGQNG